eukprot:13354566-Alexandrium_andersonii.AAC.1
MEPVSAWACTPPSATQARTEDPWVAPEFQLRAKHGRVLEGATQQKFDAAAAARHRRSGLRLRATVRCRYPTCHGTAQCR